MSEKLEKKPGKGLLHLEGMWATAAAAGRVVPEKVAAAVPGTGLIA